MGIVRDKELEKALHDERTHWTLLCEALDISEVRYFLGI